MPPTTRSKTQQPSQKTATSSPKTSSQPSKPPSQNQKKSKPPQANTAQKRKSTSTSTSTTNPNPPKRTKPSPSHPEQGNAPPGKIGSKHMPATPPAPRGSATRLPQTGQSIVWKAMPGYVDGTVVEILTKGKTVDGKNVKASEDDPKVVLRSRASGKICVHKPDVCFFD